MNSSWPSLIVIIVAVIVPILVLGT